MQTLPLLNNELTRLSRKRSLHGIRLGVIGLMFAAILIGGGFATTIFFLNSTAAQAEQVRFFFNLVLGWTVFVAAFAVPVVRATDAISAEKRDGTLGILLLANTRPTDVVLAKYAIVVLESASLLLCVTPIYAMSAYFGGTELRDVLVVVGWTIMAILFLSSLGIYCSAVARSPFGARVLLIAILVVYYVGMGLLGYLLSTLGFTSLYARLFLGGSPAAGFTILALVTIGLLFATVRRVNKEARDLGVPVRKARRRKTKPRAVAHPLRPLLRAGVSTLGQKPAIRILVVFLFAVISFIPGFGTWLLLFLLYWDLVSGLQRFTQNGGLDDVRVADASDKELGRAAYFTAFTAGMPYLLGLVIGKAVWTFTFDFLSVPSSYADNISRLSANFAYALAVYAALVAQAVYWGVACGRRRHNGLYIFFGVLMLSSFLGRVAAEILLGEFVWQGAYNSAYVGTYMTYSEAIQSLVTALFLAGLAFATARGLGQRWRSDLGPKPPRSLQPVPRQAAIDRGRVAESFRSKDL